MRTNRNESRTRFLCFLTALSIGEVVAAAPAGAEEAAHPPAGGCVPRAFSLSVSGLVRQPLNLTRDDLRRFQAVEVQINDVKADRDYRGVFVFRGVPLKTLLSQAVITKESAFFRREMDLAIVVRSLWSQEIVLPAEKGKQTVLRNLAGQRRFRVDVMKSGTGTGYHGVRRYSGVTLRGLLEKQGFAFDPEEGFLLSAADGYRILLSSGELFGSAAGFRVLVADRLNDKPITEEGRFVVVVADDLHADRWLKAPARIDLVRATEPAGLTVIGVGPGETSLISL